MRLVCAQTSMRLRMPEERERLYDTLVDVADENTRSQSLDKAARLYVNMAKDHGILDELMSAAVEHGSLTPGEIAEIVDTHQVPVEYESNYAIGKHE